jgi:hypothetical protein
MRRALALLVLACGWLATGCPQLLDDDFDLTPGGSGDASISGGGGATGGTGGLDGSLDGGEASPCSQCAAGDVCCDDQCVDTANDPAHCGACGKGCPGTTCEGTCTGNCQLGFLDCDQNVVTGCEANAVSDPDNCGSCAAACAFDQTCDQGKCLCPSGTRNCDGDLETGCETQSDTDPENCGECGKTCGANQVCTAAACSCAPGFLDCNGLADDGCEVSPGGNPDHCGACNVDCGVNSVCSGGQCACAAGFSDCTATPGCETAKNDPLHCGNCTTICGGATPNCDGTKCVSVCPSGQTLCGGSCANLATDPLHCGACNSPVAVNQVCVGGNKVCSPGFGDCGPAAGCETNLTNDEQHCGACPTQCKPGAVCNASACECAPATPNDCGSACRECCSAADCTDPSACTTDTCSAAGTCVHTNCGGGNVCCALGCFECCTDAECTSPEVCSGNQCVTPTCTAPDVLCGGLCVDTSSDAQNCGGCGIGCGVGRSCAAGNCTPQWMPTSTAGAPSARSHATSTLLGSTGQLFVWGGANAGGASLDSGAIYDIGSDSWTPVVIDANTPSPRIFASAVWTGSRVFVWGGGDSLAGTANLSDGALYDPVAKSWSPVASSGAPSGRRAPYVFWTGSSVIVFSGVLASGAPAAGTFLYDPQGAGTWTSPSSGSQPAAQLHPTVGWSGSELFVYGGTTGGAAEDDLHQFTPDSGWLQLAKGPSKRFGAFGGFDGTYFVVWGGQKPPPMADTYDNGERYDGSWTALGAPSIGARFLRHREHGWSARISNQNTIVVGGFDASDLIQKNGAIYNAATNSWSPVSAWASGEDHHFGIAAFVQSELVVWGGTHAGAPTATGDRYRP